ncbi:MAG: amidohydrolase family protein, partial [Alphaproteobacteria bacterium]|nr:amidohydrolase family protein [Alphaproteobacteria bacterium]
MTVTVFEAKKFITLNPGRPFATHVAVRDGRVLGIGALADLEGWGPHQLDRRFADKVLMPGLVEGHSHASEGVLWRHVYCGFFDRTDPDGRVWTGLDSIDRVVARLTEAKAKAKGAGAGAPITGWGFDPIYFGARRMTRHDLDRVAADRPIGVMHASGHILNVNSKALELANFLRPGINHPGIPLGEDGLPLGEMKGPETMTPLGPHVGLDRGLMAADERGLREFARLCVRKGVTTAADLANPLSPEIVDMMRRVAEDPAFPARIVALRVMRGAKPREVIDHAVALRGQSLDRLRLGIVKIVVDGSIQGFSARLKWPGYYNGAGPGLWYVTPEELREALDAALALGV